MDNKNLIIAVLTVTAVVLLCTLVLVQSSKRAGPVATSMAWADTVDRGGDYVLVTGAFSQTDEAVYVLDGLAERINVYQYDRNLNRLVLFHFVDLRAFFGSR